MAGIVIVAEHGSATNRSLAAGFRRVGVPARRLGGAQLRTAALLGRLEGAVLLGRADVSRRLDGVGAAFWELRRLEQAGLPVLNGSRALLCCHDKLLTARRLARAGLPHPSTALLWSSEAAPSFPGPYVVKPRFGSWGADVERCHDADELRQLLRRLGRRAWFRRQGVLVQEYVANEAVDLRLIVAAGQVVGAIERVAAAGEWRTNVSRGGRRRAVEPPAEAALLARAAAGALQADLVGVDLLPLTGGGYSLIELNGAVDFTDRYGDDVFDRAAGLLARPLRPRSPSAAVAEPQAATAGLR